MFEALVFGTIVLVEPTDACACLPWFSNSAACSSLRLYFSQISSFHLLSRGAVQASIRRGSWALHLSQCVLLSSSRQKTRAGCDIGAAGSWLSG
jgi:hypothetical protein